jgi:hypothetical protein
MKIFVAIDVKIIPLEMCLSKVCVWSTMKENV